MLDKMSSNQRLILALAISFAFFMGYTTIFPPKQISSELNTSVEVKTQGLPTSSVANSSDSSVDLGHDTSSTSVGKTDNVILATLSGENYVLTIDTLGRISQKEMLEEKFADEETGHAKLVADVGAKPLYIRFADKALNKEATKTAYTSNIKEANLVDGHVSVILTQKLSSLTVTKNLTFYADGHYDVHINLSKDERYYVYLGMHPTFSDKQMMSVEGVMVDTGADHLINITEDGDASNMISYNDVNLASSFSQYFASIFYGLDRETTVKVDRDRDDNPVVFMEGLQDFTFNGYIGPKDYNILHSIKPELTNAIEYGWFTFAAAPLFQLLMFLHDYVGNWGWSIVLLTLIIRLLLFPLTFKGMISMQKLKEVSPKVKELQAKHKGDPQRMNAAVMALYKKEGANPLGGCLPLLMQIPVFFAIYRVLLNAVELKGADWVFWITDLAHMDPYFVLPILMGATMYYQQRITPSNFTDPMQEKIFRFLPIIFTFFFVTFPAGLVLYWLMNNIFSIIQQFIVNNKFKAMKKAKED
ncbi:membrane protein insertase YidC [Sulfurimonas sp. MAG313]|nr:membrane protein insertase YidC [Sulfurimonas sp. MAG313]MDF1881603.1 membrane protein insertase YidC [Sulfurimonas sp. MAG313]